MSTHQLELKAKMLSDDWQKFLIMFPLLSEQRLTSGIELDQYISSLQLRGMSSEGTELVEQYIKSCWAKGVDVVLDPNLEDAYGLYDPTDNVLTLGSKALDCNVQLIETLEHEFVHVLQDQMAGIHNSDMELIGLPQTEYGEIAVESAYSHLSEEIQELETEAFSAEELIANPEVDSFGLLG